MAKKKNNDFVAEYDGIIISARNALASAMSSKPQPNTQSQEERNNAIKKYVDWGTNNDFPVKLRKEAETDTILLPGIRLSAKLLYGGGLSYGKFSYQDGKRDWQYVEDKQVRKWLRDNNISRQLFMLLYDVCFYGSGYLMMTLSADGKQIARVSLKHSRASYVRLSPINRFGEHELAFINADYGTNSFVEDKTVTVKVAPEFGAVDWIKQNLKGGDSFILPIKSIDAVRQNYPQVDWYSSVAMGWSEIGKDIAKLNKAYLKNAIRPMWHVEVHPDFWPTRYGAEKWASASEKEKVAFIKDFHSDLSDILQGVDKSGGYISTPLAYVKGLQHEAFSLVKITSLENKVEKGKDGWYLNTSRESGQHKVVSLGLDSAMMGTIPGDGGMGAGSGSNNRVAFNQRVLLSKAEQDMYLNFMYLVSEYNGWDDDLEFTIEQGLITTLDSGAEASAPAAPANNNGGVA